MLGVGGAQAETYPSRPITLLVPAAPGGGNDTVARVIAEKMSRLLGQQIVIENRPGAGGSIAARQVARSEPDGYTHRHRQSGDARDRAVDAAERRLRPGEGLRPRSASIAASPHIILVNNGIPAKTLAEFIALAKQEPGKFTYASGGAGSPAHLGPELLASIAGIKLTHVPYKGTGPAIADLLGGHVSMTFSSLPPALGLVRDGKARPLAITSATRSRLLPDVPTVAETLPGYESAQRYGIVAPAQYAARDRGAAQRGAARGARLRRRDRAHRRRGRRADAGHAGRVRGRDRARRGEMVEDHPRARGEDRMRAIRT